MRQRQHSPVGIVNRAGDIDATDFWSYINDQLLKHG